MLHTGCETQAAPAEGAVRLRGGFGTPCDPLHSGFVEVLHNSEWGSICSDARRELRSEDNLVADVVCRQLGFPHGTRVNPLTPDARGGGSFRDYEVTEEAEEPVERFWLSSVMCRGLEGRLTECSLGQGFRDNDAGCSAEAHRIHVACRQFPVVEALEAVTTPGAGAPRTHT